MVYFSKWLIINIWQSVLYKRNKLLFCKSVKPVPVSVKCFGVACTKLKFYVIIFSLVNNIINT